MWKFIRCLIGWHRWFEVSDTYRYCLDCQKRQRYVFGYDISEGMWDDDLSGV